MAKRRFDDDEDEDGDDDGRPRKGSRRDDGFDIPKGTPRNYVCKDCGETTKMPAEEIAKYLENPFELGEGEDAQTFCSGCDENVPFKRCKWEETGQNCYEYLEDLRAEMLIADEDPRGGPGWSWWLPPIVAVFAGLIVGGGGRRAAGLGIVAGLIAAAVGLGIGLVWMFVQRKQAVKESLEWNEKLIRKYYKRYPDRKPSGKKRRRRDDDDEEDDDD